MSPAFVEIVIDVGFFGFGVPGGALTDFDAG
jgi:hypothetical protein